VNNKHKTRTHKSVQT